MVWVERWEQGRQVKVSWYLGGSSGGGSLWAMGEGTEGDGEVEEKRVQANRVP